MIRFEPTSKWLYLFQIYHTITDYCELAICHGVSFNFSSLPSDVALGHTSAMVLPRGLWTPICTLKGCWPNLLVDGSIWLRSDDLNVVSSLWDWWATIAPPPQYEIVAFGEKWGKATNPDPLEEFRSNSCLTNLPFLFFKFPCWNHGE